ncbi:alpha/beta fold hydrolase [Streptomyces sp. NPDC004111]|uniref:alpha/beta fold hydrolase n=1 Tax=Streptomyces sp. NPDC004111 TaxID=3364690 RepID=UPI00367C92DC
MPHTSAHDTACGTARLTAPDGTKLAFHVRGEGAPLLVLPGGPMRASAYLGDLGGLSEHRRLIMPDLRGTGESGVPADPATYRCDRLVDDVEALRAHLGIERVDLLAHSAAGDLALLYAARYPRRIRSLTFVTARARALGVDFTVEQRSAAAELRAGEPWYGPAREAFEVFWRGTPSDEEYEAVLPFFYGRWDTAAQEHAASDIGQSNEEAGELYASEGAFDPATARSVLAGLDVPVLVLAGEWDGGPCPEVAAEIAKCFPRAELTIQSATAHYPWLDDPERFVAAVAGFLGRVSG